MKKKGLEMSPVSFAGIDPNQKIILKIAESEKICTVLGKDTKEHKSY
jgi:hypothetical protein